MNSGQWNPLIALLCALAWVIPSEAQNEENGWHYGRDPNAKAGVFTFRDRKINKGYVFAANCNADGDIFFHMSGPRNGSSWIGAGIGTEMKDALMFIAYAGDDGLTTTISARIGTGQSEPVHDESLRIELIYTDEYAPEANTITHNGAGSINAHAICYNCSRWATGALDLESEAQPWFFAMGPRDSNLKSDSLTANLPRHDFFGHYTMNMPEATNSTGSYARVPGPNTPNFDFPPSDAMFARAGVSDVFSTVRDSDRRSAIHGALMCVAFIVLFPGGAVILRLMKNILYHAVIQVIGVAAVISSFVVAYYLSRIYNKSSTYTSAHQVLGLIILAALLLQAGLGLLHHTLYARTKSPTPMGRIHILLGPLTMILGLINIGVGFNFAGNSHYNLPYGIIVGGLVCIALALGGCLFWMRNRRRYRPERGLHAEPYVVGDAGPHVRHSSFGEAGYYHDYELRREPSSQFGVEPPGPYEPQSPYTPATISTPPWSPDEAYTPVTPKTWKKEEITNFPRKQFDG